MSDLAPFRRLYRDEQRRFKKGLQGGKFSAYEVAVRRIMLDIMDAQLRTMKSHLRAILNLADPPSSADLVWHKEVLDLAAKKLDPAIRDPAAFRRKKQEYETLKQELRRNVRKAVRHVSRRRIEIVRHNPHTKKAVDALAFTLVDTVEFHRLEDDFMRTSARSALYRLLLEERPDLLIAYRTALRLGPDVTTIVLPEAERPAYVEAIEFGIGLIPIIGNAVAAYEAYRGKDLFGYRLSDVERGVLGASILLPAAGRLVKGGRALYTANRMQRLYGDDAFKWSYSLAMGERMSDDVAGLARLKKAESVISANKRVAKELAEDLAETLKGLNLKDFTKATAKSLDDKVAKAFKELTKKHPKLVELDELAIERIAAKGPNTDHVKGQILEELLENQVVKWLREPAGKRALGLEHIDELLHFIPGHLVRDANGRQITDGIIARQVQDTIEIVTVFEAKAGRNAARELSRAATSRSRLTKSAEAELRAYAKDVLRELQEQARLEGKTVSKSIDDVMKEIKLTEMGGQVRRDIERLDAAELFIGSTKTKVKVTPKTTKFFGVLPSDVKASTIKKQLADAGLRNFEVIGFKWTSSELTAAAKSVVKALAP